MYYNDENGIRDLLEGRAVVYVNGDTMILDNGTLVTVIPNEGGCVCRAGDYSLEYLNKTENVITRVYFDYKPGGDDYANYDGYYRIFVYTGDERINLLSVVGGDGNGYYGTGFELKVKVHDPSS